MKIFQIPIALAALATLGGCMADGVRPMAGFGPPPVPQARPSFAPPPGRVGSGANDGAIYQASTGYAALHEGLRARKVGDIVTIVLVESIGSSKSTSSQTGRSGSAGLTPPTAGPLSFLNPDALKAAADSSFKGTGNAAQRSTLNGAIAVTIADVRPNGTARVIGEKHMALSQGKEFVQFAGIVRLADINGDNRILSTQVADAQILYSGKGAIQRASKPGWLSSFFAKISPF
ncbi:flagellar basal body L-ring protein FlgH [Parerythrobacter jejuensis]|uniref:Flagellar L-ring protein n=1 Tax=Parerythrobacter jejuensis TaxID=795812 RepID=A0A845AMA1_9SPHN|nr:flagellar basal body L-ring protein FlgH [Parerythrobacter jejuensis]MXP30599.1 flagellar biosynthesis protein FlgH [Parerythrobacter jejuensis]MXP33359.1 flagellar biosynthesis protein FlgH [Parerythrobacter jejuensis]